MKSIEIDEELYHYIASQTQHIGESASQILRRLLKVEQTKLDSLALAGKKQASAPSVDLNAVVSSDEYLKQPSSVKRFLTLLSYLHQADPQLFTQASEIKGSKRVYFATSEEALLANGKTTNPKAIEKSPFWVITNTNTHRKRLIIKQLMQTMGYSDQNIESIITTI